MNINIKATNMELTDAISEYVNKRLESISKFAKEGEDILCHVEVGKTTNHHKQGDIFKAEFNIEIKGENYFTVSERDDLYTAIDEAREDVVNKITHKQDRRQTLFKRGAMSVKKMMKGISDRNPFTSR